MFSKRWYTFMEVLQFGLPSDGLICAECKPMVRAILFKLCMHTPLFAPTWFNAQLKSSLVDLREGAGARELKQPPFSVLNFLFLVP